MSNFGGLFGLFVIVVVTLAQLAGNGKRNRNKQNKAKKEIMHNEDTRKSWSKIAKKGLMKSRNDEPGVDYIDASKTTDDNNPFEV